MKLTVCPFSLSVFIGTSIYVAMAYRKSAARKDDTTATTTDTTNLEDIVLPVCDVVFVLGGPGVGKGTQCQLLVERLGNFNKSKQNSIVWVHLSAGDLLRAERNKSDSLLAQQINDCISQGKLVQSELTCQLIENAMKQVYASDRTQCYKFLIDGFPRSHDNATVWNTMLNTKKHTIVFVIEFVCPEEIIVARLLQRGKLTGRADDLQIATIRSRLQTFAQETQPIVDYYKTTATVHTVAADQSIENVQEHVISLFANF